MCFVNYYDPYIYNVSLMSVFNGVVLLNYIYKLYIRGFIKTNLGVCVSLQYLQCISIQYQVTKSLKIQPNILNIKYIN